MRLRPIKAGTAMMVSSVASGIIISILSSIILIPSLFISMNKTPFEYH